MEGVWGLDKNLGVEGSFFRPSGLVRAPRFYPRLAPWAAFFRRFAAGHILAPLRGWGWSPVLIYALTRRWRAALPPLWWRSPVRGWTAEALSLHGPRRGWGVTLWLLKLPVRITASSTTFGWGTF